MFVTILTIIYLALAMFILVRFFRQSVNVNELMKSLSYKVNNIFGRKSDIDDDLIEGRVQKAPDNKDQNFQPEFRRS